MAESTSTLLNFSELSDNPGSQERNKEPNTYSKSRSKLRKESSIGKQLRKSLQTCKVGNNLAKLEGQLKSSGVAKGGPGGNMPPQKFAVPPHVPPQMRSILCIKIYQKIF